MPDRRGARQCAPVRTGKSLVSPSMEPFILCENLVKIYQVSSLEVVALQGLNLVVQPGELMGIIGAGGLVPYTRQRLAAGEGRARAAERTGS